MIIFNHNRVWWDSLNEHQTGHAEFGTVPEVSLFVLPFKFLVVWHFHVDFCLKTEDSLFLSLVYKYNLECRGKGEGLISISVVFHRMSGFRVQMMTLQLSFCDNGSAAVLFWEWQYNCLFLKMAVRVQVSCSDNDSATFPLWQWQCNCPFLIMTVQLSFSTNDSATVLFW